MTFVTVLIYNNRANNAKNIKLFNINNLRVSNRKTVFSVFKLWTYMYFYTVQ